MGEAIAQKPKRKPALTLAAKENEMIALAMETAELRMRKGTASAAEICHFLKLGTTIAELEKEKLKHENELLVQKTEAIKTGQHTEELYLEALNAMKSYSGQGVSDGTDSELY